MAVRADEILHKGYHASRNIVMFTLKPRNAADYRFAGVILSEAKNPVRDQNISKANDSAVRLNICRRCFRKSLSFALANRVYTPSATPRKHLFVQGGSMATVNPLTKDKAAPAAHATFDALTQKFNKMPNFFALMAHRPDVLNKFLPLYAAIINEGTVEPRYKELAYLKTALINGCEY